MGNNNEDRKTYTTEQKYRIVKEAMTSGIGISGICRKYGISSGLYYKWQEKFLEGAKAGLERKASTISSSEMRKIDVLTKENDRMKSVIAEITAENIDFKKKLGE